MDGATLSPETLGEVRVQRDMDLVRRIMKEIRLRSDIRARPVEIDGVDPVVLGRHVEMLFKAGLVEGTPHASSGRPYTQVLVRDLSWAGHEFYGAIQRDTVWNRMKSAVGAEQLSVLSLDVVKAVATDTAIKWTTKRISGDRKSTRLNSSHECASRMTYAD